MKLILDTEAQMLIEEKNGETRHLALYSKEAFELLSYQWVRVGWDQKYPYTFSWMGRPIIQLPEDMIRIQEVIYRIKPDVIIETGIAHGGSLVFYASLCKIIGSGRIVGIDIEIRPHNRKAIEAHELFEYVTLIEGSSTDEIIVDSVKSLVKDGDRVLVILDSDHSRNHVLNELNLYCELVSSGSYVVACDGIMKDLHDVPRGKTDWSWDNPIEAITEFLQNHKEFILEQPNWFFNESELEKNVTHWPSAWLKRM